MPEGFHGFAFSAGIITVPSLPKLLELHRVKEHQFELLSLLERELVHVAPEDKPAIEAEIVYITRGINRLTTAIRELQASEPSATQADGKCLEG
jgi:hypothetical protein